MREMVLKILFFIFCLFLCQFLSFFIFGFFTKSSCFPIITSISFEFFNLIPLFTGTILSIILYANFYFIKLSLYYKFLKNFTFFQNQFNQLILQSWNNEKQPLLIKRDHADYKRFWKGWAFSAFLLFNKMKIIRLGKAPSHSFCLEVDLRESSVDTKNYGIYNNKGKVFLKKTFLKNGTNLKPYDDLNLQIQDFLNGLNNSILPETCFNTPLRWASGGVLPLTQWKGRKWFVFFFRGTTPVGLNIANGSSDNFDDCIQLNSLILREFSEELILFNQEPTPNKTAPVIQKIFSLDEIALNQLDKRTRINYINKDFLIKAKKIREKSDHLKINLNNYDQIDNPVLRTIKTPYQVKIHYSNHKKDAFVNIENILFTINPFEFGVEVIRLYEFSMEDTDYLMYGEIWDDGNCLMRDPVVLISCDTIKNLYKQNNNSLGEHINSDLHPDCKKIGPFTENDFHIFDKDIEFRQKRITILESKQNLTKKEQSELKLYQEREKNYKLLFETIKKTGILSGEASTLCPVTWKALELICKHNLI